MKAMTIEVPREGLSVQLLFRGGGPPAQAIIVAADEVEIRCGNPAPPPGATVPLAKPKPKLAEEPAFDFEAIFDSLVKLRTKRRAEAVNVIRTMFQFTRPITAPTASKILEDLRRRGYLTITPEGEVQFASQTEGASIDQG